jgi:hypothetical protein
MSGRRRLLRAIRGGLKNQQFWRNLMANWYGSARSNYFSVKDESAFRAWVAKRGLEILTPRETSPDKKLFAITPPSELSDSGGWPTVDFDCDDLDNAEIDIASELALLVEDDQIVVLTETGSEKLCYLTGTAVEFNSSGKAVNLSLSAIYELAAKEFNVPEGGISRCEY